jgi:hypothetical protein
LLLFSLLTLLSTSFSYHWFETVVNLSLLYLFLRNLNMKLEEKLKSEQQKDAIIHQLEDQRRHFQVTTETLQQELVTVKAKLRKAESQGDNVSSKPVSQHYHADAFSTVPPTKIVESHLAVGHSCEGHSHGEHHDHGHSDGHDSQECGGHEHSHADDHGQDHHHPHEHDHNHDHDHSHIHDHDHHHPHEHDHNHDHDHSHGHDHSHDHDHDHNHDHDHDHDKPTGSPRPSQNPVEEMKKRLHHLEWENSTFRNDVEKLAVDAKLKKDYEAKCIKLQEECDRLRNDCERLELLVIQLQGENDTIGNSSAFYKIVNLVPMSHVIFC